MPHINANGIDWSLIRDLALYSRHGGYAEAARQRGVTREAIYQNIKALETAVGLTLVDRTVRPSRLTADGERIAAAAGVLLDVLLSAVSPAAVSEPHRRIRAIARQLTHLSQELRAAVSDG